MTAHLDAATEAALLAEGDRLARFLGQRLRVTVHDQDRLQLIGRSLAHNLCRSFVATVEQVSRHAGRPLQAELDLDAYGRATVLIVNAQGESRARLPCADLLDELLLPAGRLPAVVEALLQRALGGSEHQATRALVETLRSKPVLDALGRELRGLLAQA
ncbi:hypothetical protein [Deinococcus navajonensis]|uniref:Uncharacterized protein n=1 Tax=Deinococcus navajonensis TaxID=309884 RepID=A0ABV8XUI6_9DEIO